jgi:predicted outer membrane lipoprotein
MIWWILLLAAAFGVVVAFGRIRDERAKRERAEREFKRLMARHPGKDGTKEDGQDRSEEQR